MAKKKNSNKKAMMMQAMAADTKMPSVPMGQPAAKGAMPMAFGGKHPMAKMSKPGGPHTPAQNKAVAKHSRKKQMAMTPKPGAALAKVPKPSALRGQKKKKK